MKKEKNERNCRVEQYETSAQTYRVDFQRQRKRLRYIWSNKKMCSDESNLIQMPTLSRTILVRAAVTIRVTLSDL